MTKAHEADLPRGASCGTRGPSHPGRDIEARLARAIVQNCPELGTRDAPQVSGELLSAQAERFRRIQTDFPPSNKNILAIYGGCIDRVYRLTSENAQRFVDTALQDIASSTGMSTAELLERVLAASAKPMPEALADEIDVLAAILRRIAGKPPDKGRLKQGEVRLEQWIDEIMKKAGILPKESAGGASSNMAWNLPREPNVAVYVRYNSPSLAAHYPEHRIRRFNVTSTGVNDRRLFRNSAVPTDPVEINRAVEFDGGVHVKVGWKSVTAAKADKFVFGASGAYDERGRRVARHFKKPYVDFAEVPNHERNRVLRHIGTSYHYVLLNGLHAAEKPQDFAEMNRQLRQIKGAAAEADHTVSIHAELSGTVGDYIRNVLDPKNGAGVDSLGLSDEDVPRVLSYLRKHGYSVGCAEDPTLPCEQDPFRAYCHAVQIQNALCVRRLYVHGGTRTHVDIILRSDISEDVEGAREKLRLEALAGLWAKYASAAKVRYCVSDPPRPLREGVPAESLVDLVKVARGLAEAAGLTGDARKRFYNHFLREGTHCTTNDQGMVSAAFVPLVWIEDVPLFMTGAGDSSTGNSIVYSGMALGLDEIRAVLKEFDRRDPFQHFLAT